ncbi:MAG TPA: prolipoprotein diacylglyceryl transferase [Vicinamibacteria bacterium]|nr:prolipoprotein diacylglyceryl transferase [Vicinamibacteria bacterium]
MLPRIFTLPAFDFLGRNVGPITLHTYGLLLAIAFLAGLWVAARLARREGLDATRVTDLGVYVLIAGLLGAKLMLVVVEWGHYSLNPREIWNLFQSGGVFYGGLLGALPVAWFCARRYGLDGWRTADALAPGVVLGQTIGRLGCFAAGCCHGRPADVPWAVRFTDVYASRTVGTPLDTPLHPTQLYEAAANLAIFAALLWLFPRKRFHGQVACAYGLLYAIARFAIEFGRGDAARGFVFGGLLSTSQFIAVLIVLAVGAFWPYLVKTNGVQQAAASQ